MTAPNLKPQMIRWTSGKSKGNELVAQNVERKWTEGNTNLRTCRSTPENKDGKKKTAVEQKENPHKIKQLNREAAKQTVFICCWSGNMK